MQVDKTKSKNTNLNEEKKVLSSLNQKKSESIDRLKYLEQKRRLGEGYKQLANPDFCRTSEVERLKDWYAPSEEEELKTAEETLHFNNWKRRQDYSSKVKAGSFEVIQIPVNKELLSPRTETKKEPHLGRDWKAIMKHADDLYKNGKYQESIVMYRRGQTIRPNYPGFRTGIQNAKEVIKDQTSTSQEIG